MFNDEENKSKYQNEIDDFHYQNEKETYEELINEELDEEDFDEIYNEKESLDENNNYPENSIKPKKYNITIIIPLLERTFKITSIDILLNILKKLLAQSKRSKSLIKEKELNLMLHETVYTLVEKNISRKLSVLTNKSLVINISDYHNCIIDSNKDINLENDNIKNYLQSYENLIQNYNKNLKITHLMFYYIVEDIV